MDTMPVYMFLCLLWTFLQYCDVAGAPFKNIPTPFALPGLHIHGATTSASGLLSNPRLVSLMCPVPIAILNRSVSCDHSNFRRLELSDDILKRVLADEGGNYIQEYMASSDDEASQNFKNLITLNPEYKDGDLESNTSDYSLNKNVLLSQLEAAYGQYYDPTRPQVKPSHEKYMDTKEMNESDVWRSSRGDRNPDTSYFENGDSPDLVPQKPERKRDNEIKIPMHILTKLLPAQYVHPENRRHRRDADGSTSKLEYCLDRTKPTADGYLRLCSTCAHTTTLASNFFPRKINEVWCSTDSKGCMYVGGVAHGGCRQSTFWLTILRKKPNSCMTVLKDGQHYITDEWEGHAHEFKLGCQCMLQKTSLFAKYLVP